MAAELTTIGKSIPMTETANTLVISIGGTPEPVAFSIEQHQPQNVIFFASADSRKQINQEIRSKCSHEWRDQEVIATPNHEDLNACMETLIQELPQRLSLLGAATDTVTVDYTGGTKTMSAALVLATIHLPVRYSYVGGRVRSKEGMGVVLDGSEAVISRPNPWDALAIEARARMARQFNEAHFAEAERTAREAAERVSERLKPYYSAAADLCEGYRCWQGFDYKCAKAMLHKGYRPLRNWAAASNEESDEHLVQEVGRDVDRLETLEAAFQQLQKGQTPAAAAFNGLVADLVAWAERTHRLNARTDDAIARLYSALEKLAKASLAMHGIDNGKARPEEIPEPLRAEFERKYADEKGQLRFGLDASYRVLEALGDPVGQRYASRAEELGGLLDVRNNSLMVHGWKPVKADTFDRMLDLCLTFMGQTREELPPLPVFPER